MEKRHILLLANDDSGVLNKISGLFQKRNISIDTITAGKSIGSNKKRITISGTWDNYIIGQVIAQAKKLYNITIVKEFSGESIDRELALIKLDIKNNDRTEVIELLTKLGAKLLDETDSSIISEFTGGLDEVEAFFQKIEHLNILEVARTGITCMHKGLNL